MRVPDQTQPTTMGECLPSDAVGRRVACDRERGTVRFVGSVPPTAGLWLGVEWDNTGRGKHIAMKVSTTSRAEIESLHPQERKQETDICFGLECGHYVLLLSDQDLSTPHVLMLDLCGNLLCCWDDVMAITEQMAQLKELQLSHNRLRVPSNPTVRPRAFSCLRVLSLTNCALRCLITPPCGHCWKSSTSLRMTSLNCRGQTMSLQSLAVLDLSANPLVDGTVLSIAKLPRLENLNMSKIGLSTLKFDDALPGCKTTMFPALKTRC